MGGINLNPKYQVLVITHYIKYLFKFVIVLIPIFFKKVRIFTLDILVFNKENSDVF